MRDVSAVLGVGLYPCPDLSLFLCLDDDLCLFHGHDLCLYLCLYVPCLYLDVTTLAHALCTCSLHMLYVVENHQHPAHTATININV